MSLKNNEIQLGSLRLEIEANQIYHGDQCFQVEPKVVSVIHCLYKNRNKVVSRKDLIREVWQGQIISNNAISRSISQIRKLFSLSDQPIPKIEIISSVGYRLVIMEGVSREHMSNRVPPSKGIVGSDSSSSNHSKRLGFDLASLKVILFVVFTLAIFVSYILDKIQPVNLPPEYVQHTLTHLAGIEKQAKFSPDGKAVAFAHSDKNSGDEYIFLSDPVTQKNTQLTDLPAYLLRLAWSPDSSRIIYSYWNNFYERRCAINLVRLNENKELLSNQKIMDCSERSLVNLAWNESGEVVYFNTRPSIDRSYSINRYSLITKRTIQLTLPPQNGNLRGDYFIIGNLSGRKIAIARYLDIHKIDLRIYDTRSNSILASNIMTNQLTGITWLGNSDDLLLTIDNKLYRYNYLSNRKQLYHPVSKDTDSFSTDSDAKRIVFTRSNIDVNLFSIDLPSGRKIAQITNETSDEFMPAYANTSNEIAYLSDRSGKTQIWVVDAQGHSRQVSDSPVSLGLTPLKWSPDDRFILFQHQEEIFLLDVNSHSIERIVDRLHKPYVANWSWSGEAIFYSSDKNGEWQIWQYILSTNEHLQVTLEGGYSANQDINGDLYFSKFDQSGMWKLIPDRTSKYGFSEPIKVFDHFDESNWISWQLLENNIYYVSVEEQGKGLFRYDISSNTSHLIFPFDEKYLPYFSVKGNLAIFTIMENRESSIEILNQVN